MNGTEWAMFFGTLTLMCWMGAGFVTVVLGTNYEVRKREVGRGFEVITLGLTAAGLVSAFAMATAILLF
ncbi:hypothetical protein RJJ63_03595 [Rhizobium hidalgonense]|uniref:hypothetical protein n=1 Tax=Rhizobium hidalgonense TaxID=1538159 RepID=UPI00287174E7|nr:hypothetical protein [Rhizobium hidalgonense]MDR9818393.1 hypothetical protein [Rhizobium hidalgonense]